MRTVGEPVTFEFPPHKTAGDYETNNKPMQRRLIQWGFFSGIVAVLSLLGLLLFDQVVISIFEPLLRPWFYLCSAVTPDS